MNFTKFIIWSDTEKNFFSFPRDDNDDEANTDGLKWMPHFANTLFYVVFGDARFWRVMWRNGNGNENDGEHAGVAVRRARSPATAGNRGNHRHRHYHRHRRRRHRRLHSIRYSDPTLVLAPCRPVPLESYGLRQS